MSDTVFIIMQVGAKDTPERRRADEIFNYIIGPAVAAHGLTSYRADLDATPGSITPKLLKELVEARLVIADLTGRNPNVFYELGVTHSFGRPLICVAESASVLPFDTKDERVIALGAYPESGLAYAQGEEAKNNLDAALRIVLADDYEPPSPLREVANTQSLSSMAPDNPVAAELEQMRESIDTLVARSVSADQERPSPEDITALRALIERLAVSNGLTAAQTSSLVTQTTSFEHDTWVRALPTYPRTSESWPSNDEPPF